MKTGRIWPCFHGWPPGESLPKNSRQYQLGKKLKKDRVSTAAICSPGIHFRITSQLVVQNEAKMDLDGWN